VDTISEQKPIISDDKPSAETHRLWTKGQLADFFQVKERTIDNWMRRGRVPYIKIGRCVRFKPEDVMSEVERNYGVNKSPRYRR